MSQGSLNLKIWFLCQKVCPVAQTYRQTDKVTTVDGHPSRVLGFFQPIIKDWSNIYKMKQLFQESFKWVKFQSFKF